MQRFMAAIKGEPLDRLPVSMWLHFASEHLTSEETARLHVRYFTTYDWDYLKSMNDYRYPLPGCEWISTVDELRAFRPLPMSEAAFAKQLTCLRLLRSQLGADVPIVETLFNPLQTLVRGSGASAAQVVFDNPQAGRDALEAITQTLIDYVKACRQAGVTGLFYSINGAHTPASGGLTDEQFSQFVRPYDLRILQAAEGMVRIAHIHGHHLLFERTLDYPVEAFSWSHHSTAPSLAEARKLTSAALVGGINEAAIARQSVRDIQNDIEAAVREAGPRKLLIGPGCTVPPDTPFRLQYAARQAVKKLKALESNALWI
jgi:uroporphyrinogen decarboxylase